jgi:hypothetical protein
VPRARAHARGESGRVVSDRPHWEAATAARPSKPGALLLPAAVTRSRLDRGASRRTDDAPLRPSRRRRRAGRTSAPTGKLPDGLHQGRHQSTTQAAVAHTNMRSLKGRLPERAGRARSSEPPERGSCTRPQHLCQRNKCACPVREREEFHAGADRAHHHWRESSSSVVGLYGFASSRLRSSHRLSERARNKSLACHGRLCGVVTNGRRPRESAARKRSSRRRSQRTLPMTMPCHWCERAGIKLEIQDRPSSSNKPAGLRQTWPGGSHESRRLHCLGACVSRRGVCALVGRANWAARGRSDRSA